MTTGPRQRWCGGWTTTCRRRCGCGAAWTASSWACLRPCRCPSCGASMPSGAWCQTAEVLLCCSTIVKIRNVHAWCCMLPDSGGAAKLFDECGHLPLEPSRSATTRACTIVVAQIGSAGAAVMLVSSHWHTGRQVPDDDVPIPLRPAGVRQCAVRAGGGCGRLRRPRALYRI